MCVGQRVSVDGWDVQRFFAGFPLVVAQLLGHMNHHAGCGKIFLARRCPPSGGAACLYCMAAAVPAAARQNARGNKAPSPTRPPAETCRATCSLHCRLAPRRELVTSSGDSRQDDAAGLSTRTLGRPPYPLSASPPRHAKLRHERQGHHGITLPLVFL